MALVQSRFAPRVLVLAAALLLLVLAGSARAANYTVDDNSDPNPAVSCSSTPDHCTLRGALNAVNAAPDSSNTVTLTDNTYNLNAANGALLVRGPVTIDGNGSTVNAATGARVFDISQFCGGFATTTINGLTIAGGDPSSDSRNGNGGGIYVDSAQLTLSHVAVTGNSAADGGGIYLDTTPVTCPPAQRPINFGGPPEGLFVDHSEISHNNASGSGGGIYTDEMNVSIVNSTIGVNTAASDGSAIEDTGAASVDTNFATIARNTVTDAQSANDGAVSSDGEFNAANTLLANNETDVPVNTSIHAAFVASSGDCAGTSGTSGDYNIADDMTCVFNGAHDQQGVDPKVGPLQNNGGPTNTMAIDQSSPAFDFVPTSNCSGITDDQRGVSRPQFTQCDAGAFELQAGPSADMSLTKTASPNSVNVGQNVTFTLTSANSGPNDATNTVVTDTLPAGVAFVSDSASQGSCTGTTSITCHLGTVAAGAHATITIVVRVTNAGQFVNSANVTADPADPNAANNHASASFIGVNPAAPSCVDTRKFKFALHKFRKARIVDVVVFINNKKAAHKKGHNLRSITISKLPQQVFKVKIVSTQSTGSKLISTRTYNGCIKSKPKTTAFHVHPHHHHHH